MERWKTAPLHKELCLKSELIQGSSVSSQNRVSAFSNTKITHGSKHHKESTLIGESNPLIHKKTPKEFQTLVYQNILLPLKLQLVLTDSARWIKRTFMYSLNPHLHVVIATADGNRHNARVGETGARSEWPSLCLHFNNNAHVLHISPSGSRSICGAPLWMMCVFIPLCSLWWSRRCDQESGTGAADWDQPASIPSSHSKPEEEKEWASHLRLFRKLINTNHDPELKQESHNLCVCVCYVTSSGQPWGAGSL